MGFSMSDYLETYRKEDITKEKELIKTKWRKTLDIIKEAFSDKYVNSDEAQRIIKNEFTTDCPKNLDEKFLKENLDYVLEKVQNLTEGDIKIIINNGNKEKKEVEKIDVSEIDEAKGKKGKKSKKDKEEIDDDKPEDEEEIIIDEPSNADKLAVSTAEAPENQEVTIMFDDEKKILSVREGDSIIEELEIEDMVALKNIVAFLKDFYSRHEYIVNEEGLEDIAETSEHEASETPEEEKAEKEEAFTDIPVDESIKSKFGFLQLLEEDIEELKEEDTKKPAAQELLGKAVESQGKWFTVKEVEDNDILKVMDKDGVETNVALKDITDWEKAVLPKKESVEPKETTIEEAVKPEAMSLIRTWLKKRKSNSSKSGAASSAIDKKKDVKSQSLTKSPMKKTGQKIEKVKIPTIQKKGESNKALTKTGGQKSPSKVPSVKTQPTMKKDAPAGSFSKSPMKSTGQKIPSVTPPKTLTKPEPNGSYTKNPGKPQEKIEKVAAPKI